MRAHPKPVRNRLELLSFFVNASALSPEPRLVHKRTVRWVHQSDNSVIDVRRQLTRQVRDLVFVAENGKRRRRWNPLRQTRSRTIHINPNVAVPLFGRKMSRKNALHLQLVLARKRWNLHALPAARIETPSVIAALHHFPVEPPV